MKKSIIAIFSFALVGFSSCENAANKIKDGEVDTTLITAEGTPEFTFTEENHDFGIIDEGVKAEYDFEFTNTGDAPLIITNAQGSCGCTVPSPPKDPIAPGETGKIHVSFNSSGRPGNQQKTVTLNANTVPPTKVLRISAQVTPKPKPESGATPAKEEAAPSTISQVK
tara:strand:- start:83 stop:586 length:504 start_codon:yes stop_codon:yes gene_type:complete